MKRLICLVVGHSPWSRVEVTRVDEHWAIGVNLCARCRRPRPGKRRA